MGKDKRCAGRRTSKAVPIANKEFAAVQARLRDVEDLLDLRKAKRAEGKKKTVPLAKAKSLLMAD